MTNIKINFYVLCINGNMDEKSQPLDYINASGIYYQPVCLPTLAVEVPGEDYLIEFFSHKKIYEKTDLALPELSYISKRKPTLQELMRVADFSKKIKNNELDEETRKEMLLSITGAIDKFEQYCDNEYNSYIDSLEELSSIFNSSDIQLIKEQ